MRAFLLLTVVLALTVSNANGADHCFQLSSLSGPTQNGPQTTPSKVGISFTWTEASACHSNDRVIITVDGAQVFNKQGDETSDRWIAPSGYAPGSIHTVQMDVTVQGNTVYSVSKSLRTSCPPGSDWQGTGCVPCPGGKYRQYNTYGTPCLACPAGRWTNGGAVDSPDKCYCNAGTTGGVSPAPCTACVPNTYKASVSNDPCTDCPGLKGSGSGATDEDDCECPAGMYEDLAAAGGDECSLCPVGTYTDAPSNAATCAACGVGATTLGVGTASQAQCVCAPGYAGDPADQGGCVQCPQGSYSAAANTSAGACVQCPSGSTTVFGSVAVSASNCSVCLDGFYGPGCDPCTCSGDALCDDGKAGSGNCTCTGDFGEPTGFLLPDCTACTQRDFYGPACNATVVCNATTGVRAPPGSGLDGTGLCGSCISTEFDFAGDPTCSTCAPLNFGPHCASCPAGSTNVPQPGTRAACTPCPAGTTKASTSPSDPCLDCPAGTYTAQPGSTAASCVPCPQGTYQPNTRSSGCLACPAGTTTDPAGGRTRASDCTPCPANTYKAWAGVDTASGSGACLPCRGNTTTNRAVGAAVESACQCPRGQGGDGDVCVPCSAGHVAPEFGSGCSLCPAGTVYVSGTVACGRCPFGGECPGGADRPKAARGFHPVAEAGPGIFEPCQPAAVCLGGGVCRRGHMGSRCSVCVSGWVKSPASGLCEACPSYIVFVFVGLFVIGGVVLICLIRFARKNSSMLTTAAVGFNYIQLIGVLSSYQITWPSWVQSAFDALSAVNIDLQLFKPECLASDSSTAYVTIWAVKLASPWILWTMLVGMYGLLVLYSVSVCDTVWFRGRAHSRNPGLWFRLLPVFLPEDLHVMRSAFINAAIMLAILLYMLVTNTAMEIFPCSKGSDGVYTMNREPAIICGSTKWKQLLAGSLLSLFLFSLAFPSAIATILFRRRESLWKRKNLARYGLLILRYKPRYFVFELAILARKFFMVFSKTVFRNAISGQVAFSFAVVLVALAVQLWLHPFAALRINRLETLMLGFADVVLFLAFLFAASGSNMSSAVSAFLGVLLISVVVLSLIILIVVIGLELRRIRALRKHGVVGRYALDSIDVWSAFFDCGFHLIHHNQKQEFCFVESSGRGDDAAPKIVTRAELVFTTTRPVVLHAQVVLEKAFKQKTALSRETLVTSLRGGTLKDTQLRAVPMYSLATTDASGLSHSISLELPRYGHYMLTLVAVDVAKAQGFVPPPPLTGLHKLLAWAKRVVDGDIRSIVYAPEIVRAMIADGGALAFKSRLAASPEWSVLDSMARNKDEHTSALHFSALPPAADRSTIMVTRGSVELEALDLVLAGTDPEGVAGTATDPEGVAGGVGTSGEEEGVEMVALM